MEGFSLEMLPVFGSNNDATWDSEPAKIRDFLNNQQMVKDEA